MPPTDVAALDFAPLVPRPDKIVCVGLNYRSHILETGRAVPEYPTLFAKFRSSLIGAHDEIELRPAVQSLDWEAELAIVIGTSVRDADEDGAKAAIAGFAVLNDVTARDWQNRTLQWLQGKTFEHSTPVGPCLVTTDAFDGTTGCHHLRRQRRDDAGVRRGRPGLRSDRPRLVYLDDRHPASWRHHRHRHPRRRRRRRGPRRGSWRRET